MTALSSKRRAGHRRLRHTTGHYSLLAAFPDRVLFAADLTLSPRTSPLRLDDGLLEKVYWRNAIRSPGSPADG